MKIPREKYYALLMDDHSMPGYVSASKPYFGTLQDIQALIDNLSDNYSGTKDAFSLLYSACCVIPMASPSCFLVIPCRFISVSNTSNTFLPPLHKI